MAALAPRAPQGGPRGDRSLGRASASVPSHGYEVDLPPLAVTVGRAFAAINGDVNPIHISPMLAHVFGFRSNIAHGMMLVALVYEILRKRGARGDA